MRTEDKVLIGISAIGVTLTAILVANQLANQPVPIAKTSPARPIRTPQPLPYYNVEAWFGQDGPAQPTWNEVHRETAELLGGMTGAALGKGLGPAQGPSLRAMTPTLIGGAQGYNGTVSGPAGNPVPTGVTLY